MKLKNRLSGVQVSVPDALAEDLLGQGTYQTPADYDRDERDRLAAERDRQLAVLAGGDDDEKPAKETAAQRRKREEKEADAEAERVKAEQEAAAAAGNGS